MTGEDIVVIVVIALAVAFVGLIVGGGILVLRDTLRRRGNFGLNLKPPSRCPECDKPLPMVRVPTSVRQSLWGGWTCSCGCEIDKWGNVLASGSATPMEALPANEERSTH